MKFKVGDEVRVKTNSKWEGGRHSGREGHVKDIASKRYRGDHPYKVVFNDYGFEHFHGNELELI